MLVENYDFVVFGFKYYYVFGCIHYFFFFTISASKSRLKKTWIFNVKSRFHNSKKILIDSLNVMPNHEFLSFNSSHSKRRNSKSISS